MDSASGGGAPQPTTTEPPPSASNPPPTAPQPEGSSPAPPSRYESQKRRDWNTFLQYLQNHKPPLTLARCSGAHVIEFLNLDALIGRLRAAYEENGGRPESNPFGTRAVRIYLREVREGQAKARGIPYEKKKRKRTTVTVSAVGSGGGGSSSGAVSAPSGRDGGGDVTIGGGGGSSASLTSTTDTANVTTTTV
uniref:ALOG domain-containing protein n=1 Tax=Cajanus cajan TaxID=3821 RepID=A0A151SY25_CAJCA|nr:hypothetical protein KK1_015105 [Cajanus cajan]